jgi:hemerythrin-like domain-containing protein
MAVISIPNNKSLEVTDLETHVMLCEHRRMAVESKIHRVEQELEEIKNQAQASKRLVIGAIISIITGVMTTVFSILLHNFHPL